MIYGSLLLEQEKYNDYILEQYVQYVNEAYVGKTETLLEIEKQVGIIRQNLSRFKDLSGSKEVQILNRLFEKEFGMECFALEVDPSDIQNAYTMVLMKTFDLAVKDMLDVRKYVEASRENGFKFKSGNNFCITMCIYRGVLQDTRYTDAEVVALLLHELGHNFADAIDNKIRLNNIDIMKGFLSYIILRAFCTLGISLINDIPYLITLNNKYKLNKNKNKSENKLYGFVKGVQTGINDFFSNVSRVLYKINPTNRVILKLNKILYGTNAAKQAARNSLDRRNEVIADKFAGVYGYGPELSTALLKLDASKSKADEFIENKIPGGKKINQKWFELTKDLNDFDCHPNAIQRIYEEIKLLEDELNQEKMDPKMKKVIKDQLDQLYDIVKDACDAAKADPDNKAQVLYYAFINDKCPDAVSKKIEEEITDELNKIMD